MARLKQHLLIWKLVYARVVLFTFNALVMAILGALTGPDWTEMSGQQKFLVVLAIAGTWTNTMIAFLDKSMQRVSDGRNPFAGDTEIIARDQSATKP